MKDAVDVVAAVKADAGIDAFIGGRIYPFGMVPENPTLPYLAYATIDRARNVTLGSVGGPHRVVMQISVFCQQFGKVEADNILDELERLMVAQFSIAEYNDDDIGVQPDADVFHAQATITFWHSTI